MNGTCLRLSLAMLALIACKSQEPEPGEHPSASTPAAPEARGVEDGAPDPIGAQPSTASETERVLERVPRLRADEQRFEALKQSADAAQALDAAQLRDRYGAGLRGGLSYDPSAAEFIDRIQASGLALSPAELDALGKNGFVISTRREFPTFLRGLAEIYSEHLPLFVSADALLEAVHRSHTMVLEAFERSVIIPELQDLLRGALERLPAASADAQSAADVDVYLSVALALLSGEQASPRSGASAGAIQHLLEAAVNATGVQTVQLFGVSRDEDFSQFKPRGHYAANEIMQRYFRALTWLGRVDFRLLESKPEGSVVFRRNQYMAMLLMHELVSLEPFERIEAVLRTFVGDSDFMVLSDVERLIDDLGGRDAAARASDDAVAAAIVAGGYGRQQIASSLINAEGAREPLPLNRSFALLGQRYVVDAHVLSETVHDRVRYRMLPSPLDVAFAALGNDQALAYETDLENFPPLAGALARMRVLVDAHDESFWGASLYNVWLKAIRALSPARDPLAPSTAGLPELFLSQAWGRRILNSQLASWSELRHDTQLYAKQSYSAGGFCEYPDAYVDPYPKLYDALHEYTLLGLRLIERVGDTHKVPERVGDYFHELERVTSLLGDMATRELRGEPFSEAQLAFINEAVHVEKSCSPNGTPYGWYARLFVLPDSALIFDPVIADVHTQPTDASGAEVGKVLHVGTGYPRQVVVTVDTCMGPRAYTGVVHAYHERTTMDFERLSDQQWAQEFQAGPRPADAAWLDGVLAH